ncbi:hypothetical protein J4453_02225 [Candidatus Woesearchaeota archaeon]|nr:hypothetical protein [Candidatus Woesearchaeota archaeon]
MYLNKEDFRGDRTLLENLGNILKEVVDKSVQHLTDVLETDPGEHARVQELSNLLISVKGNRDSSVSIPADMLRYIGRRVLLLDERKMQFGKKYVTYILTEPIAVSYEGRRYTLRELKAGRNASPEQLSILDWPFFVHYFAMQERYPSALQNLGDISVMKIVHRSKTELYDALRDGKPVEMTVGELFLVGKQFVDDHINENQDMYLKVIAPGQKEVNGRPDATKTEIDYQMALNSVTKRDGFDYNKTKLMVEARPRLTIQGQLNVSRATGGGYKSSLRVR